MTIPSSIHTFNFAGFPVKAFVPLPEWLRQYANDNTGKPPYWAQVWPAAKALCEVIAETPELVKNKTVLEIAAGLGLPSLLAANFASQVLATDIEKEAVTTMKQSVDYNGIINVKCDVMDWYNPGNNFVPDVLLLSDINYDSNSFHALYKLITSYIQKGTMVLLSTPQRLVAVEFMKQLQPWCRKSIEKTVTHNGDIVYTSTWILYK